MEASKPTLLVVGAGGFIGGFIASEGLRRGYDVTVAVRQSTSRRYLSDERLNFAVLDYTRYPTTTTPTLWQPSCRKQLRKVARGTT